MLFCQFGSANSLREISGGLATALGKLVHLGVKAAPARSTLTYVNAHRLWQVFQGVFHPVLAEAVELAAKKRQIPQADLGPQADQDDAPQQRCRLKILLTWAST